MLFSLRRKAPKDSLRLPPQTPIHLLGSVYTRLEGVAVLAQLAQATTRCAESFVPLRSPRLRAQGQRSALDARSACSAVDCTSLPSANTCREPTGYTLGSHKRSSDTLAVSFRSFLVRTRKGHVSPLKKEKEKQQEHTCSAPAVLFLQSYQSLIKGSNAT